MKRCHRCGTINPFEKKYCKQCGTGLSIGETASLNRDYVRDINPVRLSDLSTPSKSTFKEVRKWVLGSGLAGACLISAGLTLNAMTSTPVKELKNLYRDGLFEQISLQRAQLTEEEWELFESFLISDLESQLTRYQKGKISGPELTAQFESVEGLNLTEVTQEILNNQQDLLTGWIKSKETLKRAEMAMEEEQWAQAGRYLLAIQEDSLEFETAKQYLKEEKESLLTQWVSEVQKQIEAGNYRLALEDISLLAGWQPQNANVIALKKKCEQLVVDHPELEDLNHEVSLEEDLTEEIIEADRVVLANSDVIEEGQARIEFKMARYAKTIKPDLIEKDPEAEKQVFYSAKEDEAYYDLIFRVSNQGETDLELYQLIDQVQLITEKDVRYKGALMFYTETPKVLFPMHQWATLAPGKTTTYRVVIPVPLDVAQAKTKMTAFFRIGSQVFETNTESYVEMLSES